MIQIEQLTAGAGSFQLRDVNLSIRGGEYAVLMGKTGSGKTTLLETLCGLRAALAGRVLLSDRDVTAQTPASRGIGYVPQDRALFKTMTVHEHLAFAMAVRKRPGSEIEARVKELSELLGLQKLLARRPAGLSGGEAQRVALGRALAARPEFLLMDEPLSALDDETRFEMYGLLKSVKARTGVTVLHVTHSVDEAQNLADRLFTLECGVIKERDVAQFKLQIGLKSEV